MCYLSLVLNFIEKNESGETVKHQGDRVLSATVMWLVVEACPTVLALVGPHADAFSDCNNIE